MGRHLQATVTPARLPTGDGTPSAPSVAALLTVTAVVMTAPSVAGPPGLQQRGGAAPSGPGQRVVVPAGREFTVVLRDTLSTRHSRVGDRFTAVFRRPLRADGQVAVPAGATLEGEVTAVRKSGSAGEEAVLRLQIRSVEVDRRRVPVGASITAYSAEKRSRAGRVTLLLVVAAAALIGGLAGRYISGGGPAILVGAAVAAAAGWAAVTLLHDVDVLLPAGSELTLRLDRALEVVRTARG